MKVRQQSAFGQEKKNLRSSRELLPEVYRSLLEGFSDPSCLVTRRGRIVAANRHFDDALGPGPEDSRPQCLMPRFTAAEQERLEIRLDEAAEGTASEMESILPAAFGEGVLVSISFNPVPVADGRHPLILLQFRARAEDFSGSDQFVPADVFPDDMVCFPALESLDTSLQRLGATVGSTVSLDGFADALGSLREAMLDSDWREKPRSEARKQVEVVYLYQQASEKTPSGCTCVEARLFPGGTGPKAPVWVAIRRDIPCPREVAENRKLAYQDLVTGLPNRRAFLEALEGEVERCKERAGKLLSVYCIDLDEFKKVNDLAGHAAGDEMLSLVAESLNQQVLNQGGAARVGGDEFAAFSWVETEEEARALGERICEGLSQLSLERKSRVFTIGGSIGASVLTVDMESNSVQVAELLDHADSICLKGKHLGGGTLHLERFAPRGATVEVLGTRAAAEAGFEESTVDPLQNLKLEDLELHAMPIVRLEDMAPCGQEILLRRVGEEEEEASPRRLLTLADRRGWLAQVDSWILDQVIDLTKLATGRTMVGVNISAAAAASAGLKDLMNARLGGDPLTAGRLCVEVSERDLLREPDLMEGFLRFAADLGISTALDDFSGNWSVLDRLAVLRFSYVKFKPSVTRPLPGQRRKLVLLRSMVAALEELGIKTIAKHVESSAELEAMREAGFWGGQGFHLGQPILWGNDKHGR